VLHRLAATADGLMGNLRGDQPDKLGITYGQLGAANPKIVCAHLSAYGRDGSRRGWPGYDYLMQAEAGWLALTGEPDKALDNVERAIGAGFRRRAQYDSDPDLASVRESPRFKALVAPLE